MRYRPFTRSGLSISAITLVLGAAPMPEVDRLKLVYAAMEAGVNGFELATSDPNAARALGEAVSTVGRGVTVLTLRLSPSDQGVFVAQAMAEDVDRALTGIGTDGLDAVVVDDLRPGSLPPAALSTLDRMRREGRTRLIGMAGADEVADGYIADGEFDLLTTPFDMQSGWRERNRIKAATQCNMTVVGEGLGHGSAAHAEPSAVVHRLARWLRGSDRRVADPYGFLHHTRDWTAEEIGLAFALTEPALASVRVKVRSVEQLERLAASVDRELPNGVAAQIEMARLGRAAAPLSA